MPKVSPHKKALLKKYLLTGNNGKPLDAKNAMLKAGFSPNTAINATQKQVVKDCQAEIQHDIRKKITVDYVLSELERVKKLAEDAGDYSTATRNNELIGKFLAMFSDRLSVDGLSAEAQFDIGRLSRLRGRANTEQPATGVIQSSTS